MGVSIWSTVEFNKLTQGNNNSGQELSLTKGLNALFDSLDRMVDNISLDEPQVNNEEELNAIEEKSKQLANAAMSVYIHLWISVFASAITTVLIFIPEKVMEIIEKIIDIPYTDYDSIAKFKTIMMVANISILLWDIYGVSQTFKYI